MAHYLVTGGAGFIGSNLIERLLNDGHRITVIDNLTTGKRENLFSAPTFIEGDVDDDVILNNLDGTDIDGVVHLAAQSSGAIGQETPLLDVMSNAVSTVALIQWCKKYNIGRFIYASSMTVYGHGNESAVSEDRPLKPTGYYGVGKMASENYLRIAAAEKEFNPTCFRFYSVYGPRQNMDNLKQGMLSIYLAYLLKGVRLPVTGSLERYRDLIYIDDVTDVLTQSLYRKGMPSFVYNLGSGQATTVQELIKTLIQKLGLDANYPIDQLEGDPHDIFGSVADISLLQKDLEWSPKITLHQGIEKMLSWLKIA